MARRGVGCSKHDAPCGSVDPCNSSAPHPGDTNAASDTATHATAGATFHAAAASQLVVAQQPHQQPHQQLAISDPTALVMPPPPLPVRPHMARSHAAPSVPSPAQQQTPSLRNPPPPQSHSALLPAEAGAALQIARMHAANSYQPAEMHATSQLTAGPSLAWESAPGRSRQRIQLCRSSLQLLLREPKMTALRTRRHLPVRVAVDRRSHGCDVRPDLAGEGRLALPRRSCSISSRHQRQTLPYAGRLTVARSRSWTSSVSLEMCFRSFSSTTSLPFICAPYTYGFVRKGNEVSTLDTFCTFAHPDFKRDPAGCIAFDAAPVCCLLPLRPLPVNQCPPPTASTNRAPAEQRQQTAQSPR